MCVLFQFFDWAIPAVASCASATAAEMAKHTSYGSIHRHHADKGNYYILPIHNII